MSDSWLERSRLLFGPDALEKLRASHVLVIGLGGVGAFAAEMICRAGIGKMTIIDADQLDLSNLNRQLPALRSTVGLSKSAVMAQRLRDINPLLELVAIEEFVRDERIFELLAGKFDYVVDAIDTLSPKVFIIRSCVENGLNIVSSMGSGGKVDPGQVQLGDIAESYNCALARMIRKRLHRLGVYSGVKVVFSSEPVRKSAVRRFDDFEKVNQKSMVGTVSYMPAVFGCFCASAVIRDLTAD